MTISPIRSLPARGQIKINVSGTLDVDKTVKLGSGAAIISEGKCDVRIRNLTLAAGMPHGSGKDGLPVSHFADLRAGILKISKNRQTPFVLDGDDFIIPTGWVLMDNESFCLSPVTADKTTQFQTGRDMLYLARQSDVHPANRLFPAGVYEDGDYLEYDPVLVHSHGKTVGPALVLYESELPKWPLDYKDYGLENWPRWLFVSIDNGWVVFRKI